MQGESFRYYINFDYYTGCPNYKLVKDGYSPDLFEIIGDYEEDGNILTFRDFTIDKEIGAIQTKFSGAIDATMNFKISNNSGFEHEVSLAMHIETTTAPQTTTTTTTATTSATSETTTQPVETTLVITEETTAQATTEELIETTQEATEEPIEETTVQETTEEPIATTETTPEATEEPATDDPNNEEDLPETGTTGMPPARIAEYFALMLTIAGAGMITKSRKKED